MPSPDYITASEIAEYIYCNRAWWLKLSGHKSQNQEALAQGSQRHVEYSEQVAQVQRQEGLGRAVLLIGAVLLIIFILIRLLS